MHAGGPYEEKVRLTQFMPPWSPPEEPEPDDDDDDDEDYYDNSD